MNGKTRSQRLQDLRQNPEIPVLIIGAGINGIGTFRDLALQGVPVVMVDRGDYCGGASAASSHMAHGGIRYLENGEFRLVREAVHERNRLIENASAWVKPLPTTVPMFRWFSGLLNAPFKFLGLLDRPAERGALVIKLGLMLYDWYTRKQNTVPRHAFRNRAESLEQYPQLNPEVLYTATYYDGVMTSPERLAFEVLLDAVEEGDHALALNYVSFVSSHDDIVVLKDELTGEELEVRPSVVINAAGPWSDIVNGQAWQPTHFVTGTKGSHLVLEHPELRAAIGDHEFFFENKDGRLVLILPLEDRVLIGTTDTPVDSPENVAITQDEVDYFIDMVKRVFPKIHVDRSHIVYTLSGVRPLTQGNRKATGQISRDHKIDVIPPEGTRVFPVLSLVGGKWTTFRAFAEQVTDQVLGLLSKSRRASTASLKVGAARPVLPLLEPSREQLTHIIRNEDVVHLDDLLLRRTAIAMLGRATATRVKELAQLCAEVLGWDAARTQSEIARLKDILMTKHGMDFTLFTGPSPKEASENHKSHHMEDLSLISQKSLRRENK